MNLLPCTCKTTLHGTRRTLVVVLLNGQRLMFRRACLKAVGPVLQTAAQSEPGLLRAVQMRAGASGAAALSPCHFPGGEGAKANRGLPRLTSC